MDWGGQRLVDDNVDDPRRSAAIVIGPVRPHGIRRSSTKSPIKAETRCILAGRIDIYIQAALRCHNALHQIWEHSYVFWAA